LATSTNQVAEILSVKINIFLAAGLIFDTVKGYDKVYLIMEEIINCLKLKNIPTLTMMICKICVYSC